MPQRGDGSSDRARQGVSGESFIFAGPVPERQVWRLPESPPNLALDAVVQSLIVANVGELVGELAEMVCPDCGIKYMEFRAGGRLGCPLDYWVFSKGLTPLLQRFHGATRHVGKAARRREGAWSGFGMRTRLREAIAREEYEEAARLRDLLRQKDPTHDS